MKRSAIVGLLVLIGAGAAPAEDNVSQLRFWPGVGVGILGLSLELNVEGPRWYGGGQLAVAATTARLGFGGFAGVRGGAFLADGARAPFVGLGLGAMSQAALTDGAPSSEGWGVSAEVGTAFRRDQSWFHPQIVLQGIVPFAQHTKGSVPPGHAVMFFAGVRLL
jgi:hypothetical protein